MSYSEVVGVIAYLFVLWVVSATAAGAMLWGAGLGFHAAVRLLRRWRGASAETEAPGQPHPTRKHGRRILPQAEPPRVVVRHRVHPLF